jgi:large conductance mechanosensitive channel
VFKFFKAFEEFISRGSVVDLAVGIIIGAAFSQVVNSLVTDIISPAIGIALGRINFGNLQVSFGGATFKYGAFIQAIIYFLITAFALFLIVQAYNHFMRKEDQKKEVKQQVEPSQEVVLLTQIRDGIYKMDGNQPAAQANPIPPKQPQPSQ